MPEINVSKDALMRVKTALNDYHIDISGFSARLNQQASDIFQSTGYEIQKIEQQIEETINKIKQLKKEIEQLTEDINRLTNEKKRVEKLLDTLKIQLEARGGEAACLKRLISEIESQKFDRQAENMIREQINKLQERSFQADPEKQGEATYIRGIITELIDLEEIAQKAIFVPKLKVQALVNQLKTQLQQIETEIENLRREISELNERISQLQKNIQKAISEKAKKEDELRTAERRLDRLKNKQEKMNAALANLNDNMNTMLTASKSFETQATSRAEQNVGNIEKCIEAIDAYLT